MRRCVFLLTILFLCGTAFAQSFPSRPVRWIVPFPPSGATDIIERIAAQKMTESSGQAVVVENRAGAAGAIGSDAVAKAAPDSHTLLMGTTSTHAVNPAINPKLPYDNIADFTPITLVATFPNVLVAHLSTARTLQELIAQLKANPGKYLMAVHVSFAFDQITAVISGVQAGRMRALGIASLERNAALPDIPAIVEVLPGFEATAWVGIFAPARTPLEITNRIQGEAKRIVQLPDIAQRMRELGATPVANSPAELTAFVRKDTEKWRDLVRTANIKIEQ